jgi:hypothetical protein
MPKDYVGKRVNKILEPGDEGFNNPKLPWGWMRNVSGWKKPDAIKIPIAGFFLIDRRINPPIAIFKNMVILGNHKPKGLEEPIPFDSLDEALHHKSKMGLSMDDETKIRPVALSPDPGLGNPKPNMMWVSKRQAKNM